MAASVVDDDVVATAAAHQWLTVCPQPRPQIAELSAKTAKYPVELSKSSWASCVGI